MKAALISSLLILIGGLAGNFFRYARQAPDRLPVFDKIPYELAGYYGREKRLAEFNYVILQADTTTLRLYRNSAGNYYWLFIAYFESQEYGSQMHSPRHCLPGGGWRIQKQQPFELKLADGKVKTINRLVITQPNSRQVMYYWYQTRGGALIDEFDVKVDLAVNSLMLRPTDAAFIRLTVPVLNDDFAAADARAVAFLRRFHDPILESLPFDN